jgi:hypothetical protein
MRPNLLVHLVSQFAEVKVIVTKAAAYFIREQDLPEACRPLLGAHRLQGGWSQCCRQSLAYSQRGCHELQEMRMSGGSGKLLAIQLCTLSCAAGPTRLSSLHCQVGCVMCP